MIEFRQLWAARYTRIRYWVLRNILRPFRFTSGFESAEDFDDHYRRHGREHPSFGKSAFSYARFADTFCGDPKQVNVLQHKRNSDGATVRCEPLTKIVGVHHENGFIGTCHVRSNAMNWFRRQQLR
jgi:hypothetical protein